MNFSREPEYLCKSIEEWIKARVGEIGAKGAVVGLSGGVDSAVISVILRRVFGRDGMLAVIMPCHSNPEDHEHASILAEKFDIRCKVVDLSDVFDLYRLELGIEDNEHSLSLANTKARLRMTTLYALAQENKFVVCGTGNKAELTVGYFTKYGDSGSDFLPLGDLLKCEVYDIARLLGVPDEIINKAPSAGLWSGQTDEKEMGLYYGDIDRYVATGKGDAQIISRIKTLNSRSAHKRATPPICVIN